ncbi:MAG: hypothetical protein IK147_01095, partial [Clostridia bacterium]|nr:hypothetical protein [Clostridia bacterium]
SEGIDDYNYLAFAQSLIDEISDESLKATYQARFDGVYDGLFEQDETGHNYGTNTKDSSVLKARRNALAELIEDLFA